MEKLMTTEEVGFCLRCQPRTVRRKVRDEGLRAIRVGRRLGFRRSDVEKWIRTREVSVDVKGCL